MSDLFNAEGRIEINTEQVLAGLRSVDSAFEDTTDSMRRTDRAANNTGSQFNKLGDYAKKGLSIIDSWAKKVAIAVSALGTGMLALGIKSNASLESSTVAWETLLGTQEKASEMIKDITKYAATTPFSKMGVDAMAKQLHNAGYEGQALFDQLTKFGNMGGAFGVQEDSLKEMVRQYSQVQMATVAYTEDLNILQDRGIPIYKELSNVLGISVADIKKMASEGKITSEIYNEAINKIADSTSGAMEKQSKTFNGMLSTIKDNISNISQKIVKPMFEKIIEVMPKIIELADNFGAKLDEGKGIVSSLKESILQVFGDDVYNKISKIARIVTGLTIAYGILKTVMFVSNLINSVSSAWGVLSTALGINTIATEGATVAQLGLNLAFLANPITWIILLIGSLVGAIIYLWNNVEGFREFWINAWDKIKNSVVDSWNSMITSAKENWEAMKETISNKVNEIKQRTVDKFNEIKQGAIDKFNDLKEGIMRPINWARDKLSQAIEKMKSFFKFDWELPKIKMPHFNISGKFSLSPPSIPKFSVDWYSKGGIFKQPTVLGGIGVGDAYNGRGSNAEAVVPLDELYNNMEKMFNKYSRPGDIVMKIDGREFMRAVAPHQKELDEYNSRNPQYAY